MRSAVAHAGQDGQTLVEGLVTAVLLGIGLSIAVGSVSTFAIGASKFKNSSIAYASMQHEMDSISASAYNSSATSYSACYTVEGATAPAYSTVAYQGACPSGANVRVDAVVSTPSGYTATSLQQWSLSAVALPGGSAVPQSYAVYKANR